MGRDVHLPMPPDADPAGPDFVAILNDRLRRLSDAIADLQKQLDQKAGK